jgi:hypothetical protein
LALFTDRAYNLILLAGDEARMLGRPAAELVETYAARLAITREPPQPGPNAPVFERFTGQAHAAFLAQTAVARTCTSSRFISCSGCCRSLTALRRRRSPPTR